MYIYILYVLLKKITEKSYILAEILIFLTVIFLYNVMDVGAPTGAKYACKDRTFKIS